VIFWYRLATQLLTEIPISLVVSVAAQ